MARSELDIYSETAILCRETESTSNEVLIYNASLINAAAETLFSNNQDYSKDETRYLFKAVQLGMIDLGHQFGTQAVLNAFKKSISNRGELKERHPSLKLAAILLSTYPEETVNQMTAWASEPVPQGKPWSDATQYAVTLVERIASLPSELINNDKKTTFLSSFRKSVDGSKLTQNTDVAPKWINALNSWISSLSETTSPEDDAFLQQALSDLFSSLNKYSGSDAISVLATDTEPMKSEVGKFLEQPVNQDLVENAFRDLVDSLSTYSDEDKAYNLSNVPVLVEAMPHTKETANKALDYLLATEALALKNTNSQIRPFLEGASTYLSKIVGSLIDEGYTPDITEGILARIASQFGSLYAAHKLTSIPESFKIIQSLLPQFTREYLLQFEEYVSRQPRKGDWGLSIDNQAVHQGEMLVGLFVLLSRENPEVLTQSFDEDNVPYWANLISRIKDREMSVVKLAVVARDLYPDKLEFAKLLIQHAEIEWFGSRSELYLDPKTLKLAKKEIEQAKILEQFPQIKEWMRTGETETNWEEIKSFISKLVARDIKADTGRLLQTELVLEVLVDPRVSIETKGSISTLLPSDEATSDEYIKILSSIPKDVDSHKKLSDIEETLIEKLANDPARLISCLEKDLILDPDMRSQALLQLTQLPPFLEEIHGDKVKALFKTWLKQAHLTIKSNPSEANRDLLDELLGNMWPDIILHVSSLNTWAEYLEKFRLSEKLSKRSWQQLIVWART